MLFVLLYGINAAGQNKTFNETADYVKIAVIKYAVNFNDKDDLKVASVVIENSGIITLKYNKPKVKKEYSFNLFNLHKLKFDNDTGNCNCGITLYNDAITFWVDRDQGISIKVVDSQSKLIYNAFVHLQTLRDNKDPFLDK